MSTYYGRRVTASEGNRAPVSSDNILASVYNPSSKNLWAHTAEAWLGPANNGEVPDIKLVWYDTAGGPDDIVGYTSELNAVTQHSVSVGGQKLSGPITVSNNGPENKAFMIHNGSAYAGAVHVDDFTVNVSYKPASQITAVNENFYRRAATYGTPPDPFGAATIVAEGHISVWVVCEENQPPVRGANRVPNSVITDTTPDFESDFRDRNGSWGDANGGLDCGDHLKKYRIQCRNKVTGVMAFNQEFTAGSTERANDRFVRTCPVTLSAGVYEWREQQTDWFDETYAWQDDDWLEFTVTTGGVSTTVSPAGDDITDLTPDVTARWHHASATAMAAWKAKLMDGDTGVTIYETTWVAQAVASSALPGTLYTLTWANLDANGWNQLVPGRKYKVAVNGRTAALAESGYSAPIDFVTNYAPTVPLIVWPTDDFITTTLPLRVRATWSDVNDLPTPGSLTGVFRITRPNLTQVDVTPVWDSFNNEFYFDLTATQLNAFGLYALEAYSYDGSLYSGDATSLGSATSSTPINFQYVSGPTVTITSPTENQVLTTATHNLTWTTTGQAQYRVMLFEDGVFYVGNTPFDTGWVVSGVSAFVIPASWYENGKSYDLLVGVKNGSSVEGWSAIRNFSVAYTAPDAISNLIVQPYQLPNDPWPTAIEVTFDQYTNPDTDSIIITRWATHGVDEAQVQLAKLTSTGSVRFVDFNPQSGVEYFYRVQALVAIGDEFVLSVPAEGSAIVNLRGVVLTSTLDPENLRCVLTSTHDRTFDREKDDARHQKITSSAPTTIRRATRYWVGDFSAKLFDQPTGTGFEKKIMLQEMEAEARPVCYRDDDTRKLFMSWDKFSIRDEVPDWYTFENTLIEEDYREGVTLGSLT